MDNNTTPTEYTEAQHLRTLIMEILCVVTNVLWKAPTLSEKWETLNRAWCGRQDYEHDFFDQWQGTINDTVAEMFDMDISDKDYDRLLACLEIDLSMVHGIARERLSMPAQKEFANILFVKEHKG